MQQQCNYKQNNTVQNNKKRTGEIDLNFDLNSTLNAASHLAKSTTKKKKKSPRAQIAQPVGRKKYWIDMHLT